MTAPESLASASDSRTARGCRVVGSPLASLPYCLPSTSRSPAAVHRACQSTRPRHARHRARPHTRPPAFQAPPAARPRATLRRDVRRPRTVRGASPRAMRDRRSRIANEETVVGTPDLKSTPRDGSGQNRPSSVGPSEAAPQPSSRLSEAARTSSACWRGRSKRSPNGMMPPDARSARRCALHTARGFRRGRFSKPRRSARGDPSAARSLRGGIVRSRGRQPALMCLRMRDIRTVRWGDVHRSPRQRGR